MALDNAKWFDDNVYLTNKLAQLKAADADTYGSWTVSNVEQAFVDAGFAQGAEGVFAHFNQYGNTPAENISPNSHFNADQYYIFKAANLYHDDDVSAVTDAEAAYVKTAIKEAGMSAWQHYVDYGTEEGVNPSNDFDTNKYLQAKADALNAAAVDGKTTWTADEVAKAISDAGMNALSHAMQYADGTTAGEAAAPFDANGKVIDAYKVDNQVDAGDGETYTLTTAPDNIPGTAGNDTINGYINAAGDSTFTGADVINGAGGTDTFNITVENVTTPGVAMPTAQITNVEKFMIRDVSAQGNTYNFSAVDGETEVWADRNNGSAVTFNNLGNGTIVGVKGATGINNGAVTFSMEAGATSVDLAFDSVKGGTPAVASSTNAATAATITSSGTASTVGNVTLSTANTVKTLEVTANADLTTGNITGFATDATITVGGSADAVDLAVLQDEIKKVDASGFSGGVTTTTGNLIGTATTLAMTEFTGGNGDDDLTVTNPLAPTAKINLGTGADVFTAAKNIVASTNTIDGGAGTDTLALAAVDAANASVFKNFEVLSLDGLTAAQTYDLALLEKSTVEKMVLSGTTGAAAVVDKITSTAANLEVTGAGDAANNVVYNVVSAATGTSDSFTVTFANSAKNATAGASATLSDIETVNVVSGGGTGTANTFVYADASTTAAANAVTVKASGANDLTVNMTGAAGAADTYTLDAGSLTGKLTATSLSTQVTKVIGGSADDSITVAAAPVTVDLSKGGDDTVNVKAATGATNYTTITGATAGDKIVTTVNAAGTIGAATDLAGATDMTTVLNTLAAASGAGKVAWAAVGDTIYAVAGNTTLTSANVIALTGVSTLEGDAFAADGTITLA